MSLVVAAQQVALGYRIAALTALPGVERAKSEVTTYAAKTLVELKAFAGLIGSAKYKVALERAKAGPEPWGAFTGHGPGHPPAAVELLLPPMNGSQQIAEAFRSWAPTIFATALGPGGMFVKAGFEATDTAKVVFERAVAAGAAAAEGVGNTLKWAVGALVAGLGVVFLLNRK